MRVLGRAIVQGAVGQDGRRAGKRHTRELRWRHRGSFLVLWEDIEFIGREEVRLREGFTAYSTALDGPE